MIEALPPPADDEGIPTTDLRTGVERLRTRDGRPSSARALALASDLLAESLAGLTKHDLEEVPVAKRLELAAKLEQAAQSRRQADAGERQADLSERELDERIAARLKRLSAAGIKLA